MLRRIESGISAKNLGVDYLFYLKECATHLGLNGIVFTKDDGSVKIIAEGEDENLIKFEGKIKESSFLHPMRNFYIKWEEPSGEFKDFTVDSKE